MIHIEGMGVVGSILAYTLGEEFTWSDIDAPVNAWQASVPTIRPGSPTWETWLDWSGRWWAEFVARDAPFYFTTKRPPEGARIGWSATQSDPWKRADGPAVIIHAQHLVAQARAVFDHARTDGPEPGDTLIVAHGFGDRLHHYLWGWSCLAQLETSLGRDAALDHRVGKFVSAYAAPVPGDTGWWRIGAAGGTGLRPQAQAHECDVEREVTRWREVMAPLGVSVSELGESRQGWRPVQAKGDDALALRSGQRITIRPMSHSGFALAPLYVEAVKELL